MRIQPINNTNYRNYAKINNKTIDNISTPSVNNVSFGSLSSLLLYAVAKEGISTLSKRKYYEFLKNLDKHIFSSDIEKFNIGINALTKTPNSLYDSKFSRIGVLNSFSDYNLNLVQDLRWKGLKKIHLIGDSSYINVQTKKDFLMSLFENGHPISPDFVKQFKFLDDRIYGTFKRDIIDIALYSIKYNSQRNDSNCWYNKYKGYNIEDDITKYSSQYDWTWHNLNCRVGSCNEAQHGTIGSAYQNLKLIASINNDNHSVFISQRKNSINQMKSIVENAIQSAKNMYKGYWTTPESQDFYNDFIQNLKSI